MLKNKNKNKKQKKFARLASGECFVLPGEENNAEAIKMKITGAGSNYNYVCLLSGKAGFSGANMPVQPIHAILQVSV